MKKSLLYLCTALGAFSFANAQEFFYDNYNTLTVGNIGTNLAGTVLGQGGYYTYGGTGATNATFQVVSDTPTQGNVVQMTGSATATGTWYLFKDITAGWAARTTGNNILNVEFDIFTGGATTSKNTARVYIFNSDGSTVLGGLSLNLETKAISGIAYYDPNNGGVNPIGTYSFNLGASNAVINLTASSWVRLGLSYDTVTKDVVWKGPGFWVGVTGATPATGTTAPSEIDYLHTAGTGNTVSATSKFDNLMVRANATENLLGNSSFNTTKAVFSIVYPNPVTDFASISLVDTTINAITVMDINGRIVKSGNSNELATAKIDLSDLTAGIYLMKIETDNGVSTEKIIKK
ncbi:T9SS type A sorting domain-containing protein [Flavobacterium sp.]|jgi:hypothetical protein|uniref:T9SS type A sorting domain-containing protein n=1 Tax=Flavobacterium sp. TaxID=239 RepID=UPI0037C11378